MVVKLLYDKKYSNFTTMSRDKPLLATLIRHIHLMIRRQVHADIRAAGFGDLTPAHLYVFQLPGPDGARPTELAARLNMTKQATNHLLSGLEERGYIERVAAAGDGRGKVLRTTPRGREVVRIMRDSALRLEDEWANRLGSQTLGRLRQELAELADASENPRPPSPVAATKGASAGQAQRPRRRQMSPGT
jgi:DNA-binding MarR family transcriptional regulator